MRTVSFIRGMGSTLPPLLCTYRGSAPFVSCNPNDAGVYDCRNASQQEFTREQWEAIPCAAPWRGESVGSNYTGREADLAVSEANRARIGTGVTITPQTPSTPPPQAPPPGVRVGLTTAELEAQRIRQQEEEYDRRRELQDAARREQQRIAQERRLQEQAEIARRAAQEEEDRIQMELERNRQQLAARTGVPSATDAPTGVETKPAGSFPWWLVALLVALQ